MTREEMEQTGKYVLRVAGSLADGCYQQEMLLKAAHIIDEALEQESVLNKIKENIQFIKDKCLPNNIAEEYEQKGLQEALDIIEKYKAER